MTHTNNYSVKNSAIKNASIKQWIRKKQKKSVKLQYRFMIVFHCSTVLIGKNTKNSKQYASLETAIHGVFN